MRRRRDRLVIMTRWPRAGAVMTRLISALGPAGAAWLHGRLTEDCLAQARTFATATGSELEVRCDGAPVDRFHDWLGPDVRLRPQGAGDLGRRLAAACDQALATGDGPASGDGRTGILIIGVDCPSLDAIALAEAQRALAATDLVLGPALDGGYYLIGLTRPAPELFRDMPWGTPTVFGATTDRAWRLGLDVRLLPPRPDIDRPEDLVHLDDRMMAALSRTTPWTTATTSR